MADLRLISLHCAAPEDFFDGDEPYLVAGGRQVWSSQSMVAGETKDLSGVPPIRFRRSLELQLFDQDVGGFFDPDDFLGTWVVRKRDAGGERQASFNGDDADYTLTYRVKT